MPGGAVMPNPCPPHKTTVLVASRNFLRFLPYPPCRDEEPPMIGASVTSLTVDKRETKIRSMFNNIAPSYDLLNHLLSLNVDHYWRWRTTNLVPPSGSRPILDLCTGTGDLA